ncbi:MAG: hypothetical protein FJX25_10275 [Alphaproteobacteria bacterium]|nr:hypothetical protein [Alphaproteobacteria bacterium]
MNRSNIIDIEGQIHARTDRAILFSTDGEEDGAAWLPLSQVEVEMKGRNIAVVTLPEWLAVERGLV